MPQLPIPPSLSLPTSGWAQLSNGISNLASSIASAEDIRDVAEQQARMVLDEWLRANKDLFEARENKLTIQNIKNIVGQWYDNTYNIIGVAEWDTHYQFTLGNDTIPQRETILLHRRRTDSNHYIMEYNGKTLWLCRDEFDTIEKIIICMRTI
jgi:hypothetical protein